MARPKPKRQMPEARWRRVFDDPVLMLSGLAIAAIIALVLVIRTMTSRVLRLRTRVQELEHSARSQATRYGQITEQWAPFLAAYPDDPKAFRFLGSPIDGIQFNDDGIVFVEIKTNTSRLSPLQRQIRDHVEAGRVQWREFRLSADGPDAATAAAPDARPDEASAEDAARLWGAPRDE